MIIWLPVTRRSKGSKNPRSSRGRTGADILFCTAAGKLPPFGLHDSLVDPYTHRFSKGQDIFAPTAHIHCHALHLLAQNISRPAVILEFPSWRDFEREIAKGYAYVGISLHHVHLDITLKMCEAIRRISPDSRIILGGYGTMAFRKSLPPRKQRALADHVCGGEGVRFLRSLFGEPEDAPIRQRLLPTSGYALPWLDPYPAGDTASIATGVGCPTGCDFCSTTHYFGGRRHELMPPRDCFDEIIRYRLKKGTRHVLLVEEDHFLQKKHLKALGELVRRDALFGLRELGFFTFGSIRAIAEFWRPEEIALTGVNNVFIGVESKFAADGGYNKCRGEAEAVFRMLHSIGVETTGAWMGGWDWHTQENIQEDLDWFIGLEPTLNQLARVCPFHGTKLYDRLKAEGRIDEVPFSEMHFYGGGLRHKNFAAHEMMPLIERGYRRLYETWGSSTMRQLKVHLNGYEFCLRAKAKELRGQRAEFHRRFCEKLRPMIAANMRFAPNESVRQGLNKLEARGRRLLGEPSREQKLLSRYILYRAHIGKLHEACFPRSASPRQETPRRYSYAKSPETNGDSPYTVEYLHFSPRYAWSRAVRALRGAALKMILFLTGGERRR